jgi:tetratricopeptide (TPR) repeat protein
VDTTPPIEFEPVIDRFEAAWADAPPAPSIADYLPLPDEPGRLGMLLELIRVDLDHRRARREPARVDDYLSSFPELAAHPAAVESLRRFAADRADVPTPTGPGADSGEDSLGGQLGRYEVLGPLGRGGMGVVYRARDRELDRDVAVKVLRKRFDGNPAATARFLAEARITARLPHPGVPPVHELGTMPDGRPFLAMKVIEGQALAGLLDARPGSNRNLSRFIGIFEQVCQAVGFAHNQGVIHRDLKPSNVMVGAFGEVQVMDWGLARDLRAPPDAIPGGEPGDETPVSPARTATGSVLGTPAYMAPEQARGEPATPRADIFSLGAILFEILTGELPYGRGSGDEVLARAAHGPRLEALASCEADAELTAIARRCLAKAPAERFENAAELARAVGAYRSSVARRLQEAEQEKAAADARTAEQRKRRRVQAALAAATLLLVTGGGAFAWWQDRQATARSDREARNRDALAGSLEKCEQALTRGDAPAAADALAEAEKRLSEGGTDEFGPRFERSRSEVAMLEELNRIDSVRWSPAKNRTQLRTVVSGRWKTAFAGYGIEPGTTPPESVRTRIQDSLIRERLLAALDLWLVFSRSTELAALLHVLDPDEFRDGVRTALLKLDGPGLRELLLRPEALAQPARFAIVLGEENSVHPARARAALERAVLAEPDNLHVLITLAMTYDSSQPAEAAKEVRWYQAAVAAHPRNVIAWNDLGSAVQRSGDLDGAAACYQKVIELDPRHGLARTNLGGIRYRKGDLEGAIKLWQEAIQVDPGQVEAHINLGGVLGLKGRSEESLAHLQAAVKADSEHVDAWLNLGHAMGHRSKFDEAISCYKEVLRLNPRHGLACYGLGAAYRMKKQPREAIGYYRKSIEYDPKIASSHNSLGALLVDEGDLDGAVSAFREANRLEPKNAMYKWNFDRALKRQADRSSRIAPPPRLRDG